MLNKRKINKSAKWRGVNHQCGGKWQRRNGRSSKANQKRSKPSGK